MKDERDPIEMHDDMIENEVNDIIYKNALRREKSKKINLKKQLNK